MNMFISNLTIFILFIIREISCSVESELVKNLFASGYDSGVRPVPTENDQLNLTIFINKLSLLNLDPSSETVLFSAEFILNWDDHFLSWDPSNYSDIKYVKMKASLIWKPDVVLSTSIDQKTLLDVNERYADLKYDGTVRLSIYAVFTNLCNMKVDDFPYDSQVCIIDVGPWSYTTEEVFCLPGGNITEGTMGFTGNSEWDFKYMNSQFKSSVDVDVNFQYTEIRFELGVKRRPLFYVWVLLIPTYIITTVSIFGLFIPTNSLGEREEKVNLGLTTLLSSAVILEIVANSMPKTSALPLLGNFILAEIFMVALGVLASVLVLTLHYRANTRDWEPHDIILKMLRMSGSRKFLRKYKKHQRLENSDEYEISIVSLGSENSALISEMNRVLANLISFLESREEDRRRELVWLKFFDRIDVLLLILFQIANVLVTIIIIRH